MEMDEKKKDEETNSSSSSLIPEQSGSTVSEQIRAQQESTARMLSEFAEIERLYADRFPSIKKSRPVAAQPVRPLSRVSPSVSVKSYSSMNQLPSFHPQETQSEPLRETDSTASSISVKSESSMFEPPCFHLQREQSEPLRETDSTVSHVSMKSDSSMFEPPSFKLKRKQSQLTEDSSSCSVCEEAVRDPVRLLCGHRSCKQCVCSFWDRYGSTADYPCKKCGKRFRGEPEHQTDTEDDKKNLNLPSAPRPAPENTTEPVGREKRDQDLQSVLLEKTIKRVEMETEKLQAEKEKSQAEKEVLQAEKEVLQAEKEKSQAEKEKFELEKRKLALEIQLLEQKGKYTNYDHQKPNPFLYLDSRHI